MTTITLDGKTYKAIDGKIDGKTVKEFIDWLIAEKQFGAVTDLISQGAAQVEMEASCLEAAETKRN